MKNTNNKWQGELRRKLEREAFNEKYKCFICGKKENLHIHHLIYTGNKEDYFNPKYWKILCASCHAKTPKTEGGELRKSEILNNPNLLEKESPYIIKCDCCKKTFLSLTPGRKLCNYCHAIWMGKWHIYKVLNSDEKMAFVNRGSFSFDTADDYSAFKQTIESRINK